MMAAKEDEGAGVVTSAFAHLVRNGATFGQNVDLEKRESAERKATKTQAQLDRSRGASKLMNFRATETFRAFLKAFAKAQDSNMTRIIEDAVRHYAIEKGFEHDV